MPKSTNPPAHRAHSAAHLSAIIPGGGEMGRRIREFDWAATELGPIANWPQSLVTAVNVLLRSPVPIVMLWGADGRMLYNDAYSLFAGGRHPELLGSKVVEGWPEVADFNRNVMEHGLRGETLSYKDQQLTLYRHGEAEEVWMDLNYSPVLNDQGEPAGVWAIVIETTQRVLAEKRQLRAEEALRAERTRLHSLFMQAPALIAVMRGPQHIFEMANRLYINTVAGQRKIIGKPLMEALPELKGQGVVEILNTVMRTNRPYAGTHSVKLDRRGSGELEETHFNVVYQPVSDTPGGPATGVFVHAVDVTEQISSRRRAERLNAQLEAVFESLPDGLYIADQKKIIRINQRGTEALGYKSPDEVPRDLGELYRQLSIRHAETGKTLTLRDSTLGNALQGKSAQHHGIRVTNPLTGVEQVLRTAGAPIRNKRGEIVGAVAINNDLTELYALQEKMQHESVERRLLNQKAELLKEQNEELMKLNVTKDEFIALTSHQLRTPATGVKQYIAMLMQGYAGPVTPEQEQFLERAFESNERQLQIIDDILRVARIDMGKIQIKKEEVDLRSLLQNILDEQADKFTGRGQTIEKVFPKRPVMLPVDKSQLHMAIGNIIDNASKYTPDGKRITVRITRAPTYISVDIADEGVGIARQDIGKLFQKFSRIPNSRSVAVSGTGLGLYWSKRIIELHGGSIAVTSAPHKGTTFTIKLPR